MQIFPSLTSQNPEKLHEHIRLFSEHCAGFHIDIMDGQFVHQKMGSAELTNQIAKMTRKKIWVHIMAQDPLEIIKNLNLHTSGIVSFHVQSNYDYQDIIEEIQSKTLVPSIALNPKTPVTILNNAIHAIDHVTIMSVEPGKSGQTFLPATLKKLELLNAFKAAHEKSFTIALDGGVNKTNIEKVASLGVTQVAVSSGILNTPDPLEALKELNKISSEE